jgi:pyruvate dehydrogenase (quinone)
MGAAIPYAIAAKFAHPSRPAFCFVGDGAMQMSGMAELITVSRYWQRWPDPRFVVIVTNNRDLNMVTWEQRILEGDRKFDPSQTLPDVPYADYARMLGLGGMRIDRPEAIEDALAAALASDRPFVLDVVCDPEVPLLPPHITLEQARHYVMALAKGDRNAMRAIRESLKQVFG